MLGFRSAMSPALLHGSFEALAWILAIAVGFQIRRRYPAATVFGLSTPRFPVYLLLLWLGAIAGAYALGTANLMLGHVTGEGRSILGAILGGILVAEIYKKILGIEGSTGFIFVLPLAVAIAVGRIGCFSAGLADYTYGTSTSLPWGVDFGDGIPRHPVQLYESLTMAVFAVGFFLWLKRRQAAAAAYGFYVFAAAYGVQRFLWEFLKPYPTVLGPFNLFHLACLALVVYACVMLRRAVTAHAFA
jgi:phosphatidylglycerol:prolipoprotein diacylglycerol transferase